MKAAAVVFGSMLLAAFAVDATGSRWPGYVWLAFLGVLLAIAIANHRRQQADARAREVGTRREAAALVYAETDDPAALIRGTMDKAWDHFQHAKHLDEPLKKSFVTAADLDELRNDLDAFEVDRPPSVDRLTVALGLLKRARSLDLEAHNPRRQGRAALGVALGALFFWND
jgi:hypothetical protein